MGKKEKIEEIKQRKELLKEYTLDQRELGKIMIIVSTTLLIFSAHTALEFRDAAESMDEVNSDLDTVSGIINSGNFQNSLEVIRSLNSQAINQQLNVFLSAFQSLDSSIEGSQEVEEELRSKYEIYQWLALIAIMGDVAGIAVIYL